MKRGAPRLIGTLLGAFFSLAAFAQESGPYLGGNFGQSALKRFCDPDPTGVGTLSACDDKDTSWKLFGGYQIIRYLALEAFYIDWGKVSASGMLGGMTPFSLTQEQQSWGAAAVLTLPLSERFWVFGKYGHVKTEQQIPRTVGGVSETREKSVSGWNYYGLGGRYSLTRNWGLRAEWEQEDELEIQAFSLGLEYRF